MNEELRNDTLSTKFHLPKKFNIVTSGSNGLLWQSKSFSTLYAVVPEQEGTFGKNMQLVLFSSNSTETTELEKVFQHNSVRHLYKSKRELINLINSCT